MKENKTIRITLRLTPEQYDSIRSRAETAQVSVGAYVRAAAMRHKVVAKDRRWQCEPAAFRYSVYKENSSL